MLVCLHCGRKYPVAEGFCPMDGTALTPVPCDDPVQSGEARVGTVLDGRYHIDELIGEGGMAHVYRVTHTVLGKSFAAKVLRHELCHDEEVVQRFLREAQVVSKIKHPNVVEVSDFGHLREPGSEAADGAFCVMELLRGRTLADAIDHDGAVEPASALVLVQQVCAGLQASHDAGVVHRDIKPQNLFLARRSSSPKITLKLIDFGVARAGQPITMAGAMLGTPEYMSPEQVRGESIDCRADIYAVGILMFELLTGAVPFAADDVTAVLRAHLRSPMPQLGHLAAMPLPHTQVAIARLTAKSPNDRPAQARDAASLLERALEDDLGHERVSAVHRSTLAMGSDGVRGGEPMVDESPPSHPRWPVLELRPQPHVNPAPPRGSDRDEGDPSGELPVPGGHDQPEEEGDLATEELLARDPARGVDTARIMLASALCAALGVTAAYVMFGPRSAQTPPHVPTRSERRAAADALAEPPRPPAPVVPASISSSVSPQSQPSSQNELPSAVQMRPRDPRAESDNGIAPTHARTMANKPVKRLRDGKGSETRRAKRDASRSAASSTPEAEPSPKTPKSNKPRKDADLRDPFD